MIRIFFSTLLSAGSLLPLFAQQEPDTTALPFFIHPSKRLPDFELEDKREGLFLTGLPRFEFDPIRGFGIGGNVFLYQNRTKKDPFFAYTPYRYRVSSEFFLFENGRVRYALNFDAPFVLNSKWRVRADAVLWEDPEAQYWGIGRSSLQPLRFADKRGGAVGPVRTWGNVNAYEENLALAVEGEDGVLRTDVNFNRFVQREMLYNLLFERVELGGRLRFMFGYEALFTAFEDYTGRVVEDALLNGEEVEAVHNETLLRQQQNAGVWDRFNLAGFQSDYAFTSMLAGAVIYDTRDFEPDPSKGIFLQYSHEFSSTAIGSDFSFNKFMVQGQLIRTLARWRDGKSRLTFAGMGSLGHIFGSRINFIEMWDLSSQAEAGGILVLGGARSVRGFREARFLAPTVSLVNLEMRARLYDFKFLKQHFNVGLTPFFDMGSVYDGLGKLTFQGWQGAPGMGARLAWNQSTILRLDYAQSREGGQVFFGFGHIF